MVSKELPQRAIAITHLTVAHLSSAQVSFPIQPSRGSQTGPNKSDANYIFNLTPAAHKFPLLQQTGKAE